MKIKINLTKEQTKRIAKRSAKALTVIAFIAVEELLNLPCNVSVENKSSWKDYKEFDNNYRPTRIRKDSAENWYAVTSMEGISTWAAISGANIQEAGRAMYNLSQALVAEGKLRKVSDYDIDFDGCKKNAIKFIAARAEEMLYDSSKVRVVEDIISVAERTESPSVRSYAIKKSYEIMEGLLYESDRVKICKMIQRIA